jgi:MFS family permease
MVGGVASMTLYGLAVDRQVSRGKIDYALRLYMVGSAIAIPLTIAGFTMNRPDMFLIAIFAVQCILCAAFGPGMAIIQAVTPPTMRGRIAALMVITLGVVGYAIGPVLAGALTDFLFGDPARVGASVALIVLFLGPLAAWCLWSARSSYITRIREIGQMTAAR